MQLSPHRLNAKSLLAAAALCILPTAAMAQPGALRVKAYPKVLMPGQTAKVDVLARYPAGAYAFAATRFDVSASSPSWVSIAAGTVVGGDVLGIESSQPHQPPLGVLADPQQPYHAWTGRFLPATVAPALISIKAVPDDFWYYPSVLTSSSAPCAASSGEAWVFANPLRNGPFAVAPGAGDAVQAVPGGFVAEAGDESILMGLLLPAGQTNSESVVRTEFDVVPKTFTTTTEVAGDGLSINFTKIEFKYTPYDDKHKIDVQVDGLTEMRMILHGIDGSVSTIRPSNGSFPVRFERIPDTMTTKVAPERSASRREQADLISWSFSATDTRGLMNVVMSDGSVRVCHGVTVLAWARVDGPSATQPNLRNISLVAHRYESSSANQMIVSPKGL
ncbi:MAG: hypothetical protein ACKVW3_18235 [Phycisphaerales bacterium]